MNRLRATFERLAAAKKKALIAYLCVGDPSEAESVDLALACVEAGADILELGVPFTDPTADGPVIARASQRALSRGGGLSQTLRAAKAIRARAKADVPLVLFGYLNPLVVTGEAKALAAAKDAGVDALLVVDLPLEEGALLREEAARLSLAMVPLVAPTSRPERAAQIRALGENAGFVYFVSVAGVTGAAEAPLAEASLTAGRVHDATGLPAVVGFGVDSPQKAKIAANCADGVVVGTAIVRQIEEGKSPDERRARVSNLVASVRSGLDGAA